MALNISDSFTHILVSLHGGEYDEIGVERAWCLERSASAVFSSNGAIESSLAAKRIAPRMSPSSNLPDTLAARLSDGCRGLFTFRCAAATEMMPGKLAIAVFTFDDRLERCRLPPR
jgi:hypothetical protein